MIFKSYIIEKNYSQIEKTKSILFYGENNGLKTFFKKLIKKNNKETKIVSFLQEEVLNNTNLLLSELNNLSLTNKHKTF